MASWRPTGSPCPIDEAMIDMDKCQVCPFFRGASLVTVDRDEPKPPGWTMCCNWPRNGSVVSRVPMPKFMEGFESF